MRPVFEWSLGSRSLQLGKRTLVMGVINVTPDSFSDGGMHFDRDSAVAFGLQLLEEGADIVDVGIVDTARSQGSGTEKNQLIVGGLPLGDHRQNNKKAYGQNRRRQVNC